MDWKRLEPGGSFFIKTSANAADVRKALKEATAHLPYTLVMHNRCEFGYFGVRVWRLS